MASMTLQKDSVMPVPQEVAQMICKYLDRSELKNARLTSKQLNDAAEVSLFRYIYLRRNIDSFCRLRMLASTPHLAKLVKGIVYSSRMVQDTFYVDFDEWRGMYFGQGFSPNHQEVSDLLRKACSLTDLHRYYWNWCGHVHSQRLMQRFDVEGKDLENAFSKLPQLEEIYFGPGEPVLSGFKPTTPEHFSSHGRDMLVEPDHSSGRIYHVGQFTAMMAAAYKTNKSLKVIRAVHLHLDAFGQKREVLAMINGTMRHCKHFQVTASEGQERENNLVQIGSMLRHAPQLRTIQIAILVPAFEFFVDLSRLFDQQSHWPNLERLQLQGFSTYEIHLRKFLIAHATSLTSLSLSNINLRPHVSNGKVQHSSWVGFVRFLRESISLREMRFLHFLTNEGIENWMIIEPTVTVGADAPPVMEDLSLKQRVERYVVDGGEFPLPWPIETKDESHWGDVLRDFLPKLDQTWQYHEARS